MRNAWHARPPGASTAFGQPFSIKVRARRCFLLGLASLIVVVGAGGAAEASPISDGIASRATRQKAIDSIPFEQLDDDARQKVMAVTSQTAIYRRLPTVVFECDPTLYRFLVDHPDLVVNIWEVLGISQVSLRRTGDHTFKADDGVGTLGDVEFLYRGKNLHIVYADGSYEGKLFARPIRGQCLMILRSAYSRHTDGRDYVTCQLDTFLQVDSLGVELLAKTFQPLVGRTADNNFRETLAFVGGLSRAARVNPGAIDRVSQKLTNVDQQAVAEFRRISERLAVENAIAETQEAEELSAPVRQSARRVTTGFRR